VSAGFRPESASLLRTARAIREGEIRARELAELTLTRARRLHERLNLFISLRGDDLLAEAEAIDRRRESGESLPPLAGVPLVIKDNILTRGLRTSCASRILESFVPPYDATVIARLRQAGALVAGKANLDEFAMGSSTENSAFGPSLNPWDMGRVPGGSSGGSAAAVASGIVTGALGSDTGGSVRQPSALCGTVGLKPTYGRVSRYGLVAFGSSLDQIGPITRTVEDSALLLGTIAGFDEQDSTSSPAPVADYLAEARRDPSGLRVGVPKEYFTAAGGLDSEVESAVRGAIDRLARLGLSVREVSLPHTEFSVPTYYIVATAEASANLARYDGVRYGLRVERPTLQEMYRATRSRGFGAEVKRRIMLGTYALSAGYYDAYYVQASRVRTLLRRDFLEAFRDVDLLVTPTTPSPAFRLGEKVEDPLAMYLSDIFTTTMNLTGVPALSLPCGFSRQGLPIGCQIIGPDFAEGTLFRAARALEESLGLGDRHPPLD
jgi:aspartyl-tRNA(Asn)/glutamyl-tRNA(Gln) amidotransferase subunit A